MNEDWGAFKPRKACRIELGEGEQPSRRREESRGARRKRRAITFCTSAVTSLGWEGTAEGWGWTSEWMEGLLGYDWRGTKMSSRYSRGMVNTRAYLLILFVLALLK